MMGRAESVISQSVAASDSPVTISLRTSDNTVPAEASAYRVVKASLTDQSGAQNDVTLQSYSGSEVETEVVTAVAADSTEVIGGEDGDVIDVRSGNEIRAAVEGDADVTLHIEQLR